MTDDNKINPDQLALAGHSKARRLAAAALAAALASKWPTASRYVKRINDECGGEGLNTALVGWCDTYIDHATDGHHEPTRARMYFVRADTGGLDHAGSPDLPPRIDWAGRLVAARGSMVLEAWQAALDELPEDGYQVGAYVMAVLECVATSINGFPRGFVRMGSGSAAAN